MYSFFRLIRNETHEWGKIDLNKNAIAETTENVSGLGLILLS